MPNKLGDLIRGIQVKGYEILFKGEGSLAAVDGAP